MATFCRAADSKVFTQLIETHLATSALSVEAVSQFSDHLIGERIEEFNRCMLETLSLVVKINDLVGVDLSSEVLNMILHFSLTHYHLSCSTKACLADLLRLCKLT